MIPPNASTKRFLLWSCLWGGGVAWLLHFLAIWICAEFGCISGLGVPGMLGISRVAWLVLVLTVVFLMPAGLAFYASWRWCPRQPGPGTFVSHCGMAANASFMLVIAVQSLPVFFHLRSCGSAMG